MDDADRADREITAEIEHLMRRRAAPGPAATGFCLYCREPVATGQRWCQGTECRDEWRREQEARRRNARR